MCESIIFAHILSYFKNTLHSVYYLTRYSKWTIISIIAELKILIIKSIESISTAERLRL